VSATDETPSIWWATPNRAKFAELATAKFSGHGATCSTADVNHVDYVAEKQLRADFRKRLKEKVTDVVLFACKPSPATLSYHRNKLLAARRQHVSTHAVANPRRTQENLIMFELRNRLKNGGLTFGIAGVVGLIRIDGRMLAAGGVEVPETVESLDQLNSLFVVPTPEAVAKSNATRDRKAKQAADLTGRLEKAKAKAAKQAAHIAKMEALAAKRGVVIPTVEDAGDGTEQG
jgi:hypothetical protein